MTQPANNQNDPKKYLTTPEFRISYPYLFVPRPPMNINDKASFTMMMLFSKQCQRMPEIFQLVNNALPPSITVDSLPPGFHYPIKDGDAHVHAKTGIPFRETNPEVINHWIINAKTSWAIPVVDRDLIPIALENANQIYPGCYCRAQITAAYYNNAQRGIGIYFSMVQKTNEGKQLGDRPDALKIFAEPLTIQDEALKPQAEQADVAQQYAPPVAQAAPVTQPPVTHSHPPAHSHPPVTQPPVAQPPVAQPPVAQPPVAQPPVAQPPVGSENAGILDGLKKAQQ